jgi:hypothetical protein
MVFGPQPMLGCIGQACGRLGYRRIYVLSPNSAFPNVSPCVPTLPLPLPQFRPRRASLIAHLARALVAHVGVPPKAWGFLKFVHTLRTLMFATCSRHCLSSLTRPPSRAAAQPAVPCFPCSGGAQLPRSCPCPRSCRAACSDGLGMRRMSRA